MATFVNDLRLKEIATGDEAGTWGTSTNTNLELIAEAFSFGTEASFSSDGDATTTIADGATDPARSLYLKVTSGVSLSAIRTLTIAPNTVSKVWIIENATSGSQSINISQGSGANVTIPNGDVRVVYSDGAGSGAAVVDAFTDLNVSGTLTANGGIKVDNITIDGTDISLSSGNLLIDVAGDISLDADGQDIKFLDGGTEYGKVRNESSDFIIKSEANNEDIILRGQDGGSTIDALLLDMSEAGSALFNSDISGSTIRASGDIIAFNSSDERLKDNVEPIKFPLDKLGKIGGYEFDWNDKQQIYHGHDVGVLAQEIEEVLPEAVKDRGSGYKGVQYDKIIPLLIEGIKELKEKVKHIEENCDCLKK